MLCLCCLSDAFWKCNVVIWPADVHVVLSLSILTFDWLQFNYLAHDRVLFQMCFLVIYIQPFLLLSLQKCLSEVRGPLVDLGVSEYGILSAITTLSETQNDMGANQQQTSASTQLSYSVDDITLFRQIALDLRKFSSGLVLMSDGTVSKGILATQNVYKLASL